MKLFLGASISALALTLAGCGGSSGDSNTTDTTTPTPVNSAPSVDAGDAQTVVGGADVSLDSTATDADGDSLTYTWTQTSGTDVTLSSTAGEAPTFTAPATATSLVFSLSVSDGTDTATDEVTITVTDGTIGTGGTVDDWIVNSTKRSTEIFEDTTQTQGVLFGVQIAETQNIDGVDYTYVETEAIPDFEIVITEDIVEELNNRPKASSDFSTGSTSVNVGDTVVFGQDIGYGRANDNCDETGGTGYWPPGPACPTMQSKEAFFTQSPTPRDEAADGACEAGIGSIGFLVNGASIFGWGDTQSYNGEGVFQNLAIAFEIFDLDICYGHSANGEYHQHSYGRCLRELLGDDGTGHSPIIGYAADGYPIYGPYEAADTLAVSGWVARDYGAPEAEGGCGTPGERTCVMVDQYDLSAGVTDAAFDGPMTTDIVTTQSSNEVVAISGSYFEDFYYAGAEVTGAQLDQYNGHDEGDGRGYHYHFTQKIEDGEIKLAFPYTHGPRFRGDIPENGITQCGGGAGAPPGGGPPPPPPEGAPG